MRTLLVLLISAGLTAPLLAQGGGAPRYAPPQPMPPSRAEDSYAIYSMLLRSGPIEWRDAKRTQWLIEDTTTAMPLDSACRPTSGKNLMNPHNGVIPPVDRQAEWNELLADFDRHCHDVIQLDRDSFRTRLPVRLLNAEERRIFRTNVLSPPAEFADGAGLHSFTEVFFNASHSLALVEEGMWCGDLCGNWSWVVLERKGSRWELLPWVWGSLMS